MNPEEHGPKGTWTRQRLYQGGLDIKDLNKAINRGVKKVIFTDVKLCEDSEYPWAKSRLTRAHAWAKKNPNIEVIFTP